tara:strand:- start:4963 stop:5973 length:1011 start_codon:yes stop_codon:yes gene_type:complete
MSRVKVNEITNKVATGPVDFPDGITGVALTVTGNVTVGGTIISEDTTNVDSVGFITARAGLNVGPPATGIGATIHSNGNAVFAGITTVGGDFSIADKIIHTGDTNTAIRFPAADTITAETGGSERLRITSAGNVGIGSDIPGTEFEVLGSGTVANFKGTGGSCFIGLTDVDAGVGVGYIGSDGGDLLFQTPGSSYSTKLRITSSGSVNFNNGELIENCNVTAGKLSDNQTINLDNGMVHLFTTTETTTATPNIMSTIGINTTMSNGDAITVTLITTAAAGAYCANIQVDGAAVTENWIGGSAPSDGGSSGVDVHTFTIIKTASATFTVLGNQSKTS